MKETGAGKKRLRMKVPDDDRLTARNYCGKPNKAVIESGEERLARYNAITDLIEDPNHEVWDQDGKLTVNFLSYFTPDDTTVLLDAFRDSRDAPRDNHAPGEGDNIWPWWAEKHPEHSEVAWNIYWDYHVKQTPEAFRLQGIEVPDIMPALKAPNLLEKLSGVFGYIIAKAKAVAPSSPAAASAVLDEIVRPGKGKAPDEIKRPVKRKATEELGRPQEGSRRKAEDDRSPDEKDEVPTPLTLRASKYGKSLHWAFQIMYGSELSPRKSGLTPVHRALGANPLTPRSNYLKSKLEIYQKQILGYLTLQDLHELEALEYAHVLPNNLSNPLLPLMERNLWIPSSKKMRPDGRPYNVNDPEIWEAILPSLRLLTLLLSNFHITDWWDDMHYAFKHPTSTQPIIDAIDKSGKRYSGSFSIPRRSPEERSHDPIDWDSLKGRIAWKIDNYQHGQSTIDAVTIPRTKISRVGNRFISRNWATVGISWHHVEPLLQTGTRALTEAEKLTQQFFIAVALAHEMAHTYWHLCGSGNDIQDEPYYDDEPFTELGFSMENNVFGAYGHSIFENPREKFLLPTRSKPKPEPQPAAAIYMDDFLQPLQLRAMYTPIRPAAQHLLNEDNPWSYICRPTPIYYIETLQQQDFWDSHIKKEGGDLLKIDRWIVEWFHIHKKIIHGNEGFGANKGRGRRYQERLAEALRLGDAKIEDLPPQYPLSNSSPAESTSAEFLNRINQRMRAIALRRYMREREEATHARIFARKMTKQIQLELEQYKTELEDKRWYYAKEFEKLYGVELKKVKDFDSHYDEEDDS